tara:strand:- start:37 stop:687 length:651 start_codon:yes stop_codon:yes gene_type:complete
MNELYFAPGACSFVPHVGLEVIRTATGDDFTAHLLKLHKGEHLTPEYKALNPAGQVPLLVANGEPITQITAIAVYLDGTYPQLNLIPTEPLPRARNLSMLAWMNNTAHPAFTHVFKPASFAESESAQAEVKAKAIKTFRGHLERFEAQAPASGFFSGEQVGFVDAYAFTLLRWGGFAGINPNDLPRFKAYVERVMAEPSVAKVLATERVGLDTYKG